MSTDAAATTTTTTTTTVPTRRSYRCYHCNYSFHISTTTTTTPTSRSSFRCPSCHHRHLLPHHTISPTPTPPPPPPPPFSSFDVMRIPSDSSDLSSESYTSSSDEDDSFPEFTTDHHPKLTPASMAFVDSLSAIKLDSATASQSCPICMDDLGINSKANRLPCQHVFHTDCIVQWLNRTNTCPLCRYKLPQEPPLPSPEEEEEDGLWVGNDYYLALRPGVTTIVRTSNGTTRAIVRTSNGTTRTVVPTSNGTTRTIVRTSNGMTRTIVRTSNGTRRWAEREFRAEAQTTNDAPPRDADGDTLMVDA